MQTLRAATRAPRLLSFRMNSTTTAPPAKKKKPSPYRIPQLDAFGAAFAPLAARGWQLAPAAASTAPADGTAEIADPLQLEAKRLVQSYAFADYARLLDMAARVGRLVQEQDHHPTLITGPTSDVAGEGEGYTLRVSMLTHTPMPPLGLQLDRKLGPGVTGKDLKLATAIEELWTEVGDR